MRVQPQIETVEAFQFFQLARRTMLNLYGRWMDEKEYKDITDYLALLKPIAEKCGVTLLSMTQRPFRVRFAVGGKQFCLTISARSYSYKRIA
jgi:hypothetical protein